MGKRLNWDFNHNKSGKEMKQQEMSAVLVEKLAAYNMMKKVQLAAAVLMIGDILLFRTFILLVFGLFTMFVYAFRKEFMLRDVQRERCKIEVESVLNNAFDHVEYDPQSGISEEYIESQYMGLPFEHGQILTSQYAKADYHDVHIEMSDVCFVPKAPEKDRKDKALGYYPIYTGRWMVLHFDRKLDADVCVSKACDWDGKHVRPQIKTGNVDFDKKFDINTVDTSTVFDTVTPNFQEFLMDIGNRSSNDLYMHFYKNGKVCIASLKRQDPYDVYLDSLDVTELRKRYEAEDQFLQDWIDGYLEIEPEEYEMELTA